MRGLALWTMRRVRLHRPDRNPLRRRWDRAETVVVAVALVLLAAGVVPAVMMGNSAFQAGVAAESSGTWVSARLSQDASAVTRVSPEGRTARFRVLARWTGPDGQVAEGRVFALQGTKAGSVIRVWRNGSGSLVDGPPTHLDTMVRSLTTGLGVEVLVAGVLLMACVGARHLLDRRRFAEWDTAWIAADRRWRGHKDA